MTKEKGRPAKGGPKTETNKHEFNLSSRKSHWPYPVNFNLESLYPVPYLDGGQRAFCLDIREMDGATIAAELYSARLRLSFELDRMNRMWLMRRLDLLETRMAELRRAA